MPLPQAPQAIKPKASAAPDFIPDVGGAPDFIPDTSTSSASAAAPTPTAPTSVFTNPRTGQRAKLAPNQAELDEREKSIERGVLSTAGAVLAPEALGATGLLTRAGLAAGGAAAGMSAGQAVTGENPFTRENIKQSTGTGVAVGATDLLFGALPALMKSKVGRSFINESLGATARDVTYGNPARAMEDVYSPFTGDVEKFKAALRAGKTLDEAEIAAGGRFGGINAKIQKLSPKLNALVSASKNTVPAADVIDKPLMDAMNKVIANPAITQADKTTIIGQLGDLQQSLHTGYTQMPLQPNRVSMTDVLKMKRAVGEEVSNWLVPPRNEVQEAYRSVYGAMKKAVHANVPGSAVLDEQLTDAYAAKDSIERLARAEEVGRGSGMLRGNMGVNITGRIESMIGRALPAAGPVGEALRLASKATIPQVTGTGRGGARSTLPPPPTPSQRIPEQQQ